MRHDWNLDPIGTSSPKNTGSMGESVQEFSSYTMGYLMMITYKTGWVVGKSIEYTVYFTFPPTSLLDFTGIPSYTWKWLNIHIYI